MHRVRRFRLFHCELCSATGDGREITLIRAKCNFNYTTHTPHAELLIAARFMDPHFAHVDFLLVSDKTFHNFKHDHTHTIYLKGLDERFGLIVNFTTLIYLQKLQKKLS